MSACPPRRTAVALVLAALTALASGCRATATATSGGVSGTITVFAAASLSSTFTALAQRFEAAHPATTVRVSFGASSTLAQQILAGAPADVFASASTTNMAQVSAAGEVGTPTTFATNTAEIAVAPGSTDKVTSIADLAKPGVQLALCQPKVPCGALARTVLAKAHVSVHPVTEGLDVTSTLAYVTNGQVDAAVVYVTDVQAAGARVVGIAIPAEHNVSTTYPIATVRDSKNVSAALAFKNFVLSAAGQSVLRAAGFQRP